MKFKTNFINRFFNINPKICIYDLDGTIINSSHRSKFDENDILDLEHWKANNTKKTFLKMIYFLCIGNFEQTMRMETLL